MTRMKKLTMGLSLAALSMTGVAYAQADQRTKMDANGDGAVTLAEAQAHAAAMFDRMDVNKDGKIDQADREARGKEMREKMFARMDTDGNGSISRDEFMNAKSHGKRGAPGMDRAGMEKSGKDGMHKRGHRMGKRGHMGGMMLRMADANKDGAVTKAEFTQAATTHFASIDTNNDGKITKEEREAAHAKMKADWQAKKAEWKAKKADGAK